MQGVGFFDTDVEMNSPAVHPHRDWFGVTGANSICQHTFDGWLDRIVIQIVDWHDTCLPHLSACYLEKTLEIFLGQIVPSVHVESE